MSSDDTYPPIADYGLIGDCHTAALVSRAGSIDWCCLPRFDSGSAFGRLVGQECGGCCSILPVLGGQWQRDRHYLEDTLVLETNLHGHDGEATVLDCFLTPAGVEGESERRILRVIEGNRGAVEFDLRIAPRFDYGEVRPWIRRHGHRLHSAIGGDDALLVWCERELTEDPDHELTARITVDTGDRVHLLITYTRPELIGDGGLIEHDPDPGALEEELQRTIEWWREWARAPQLDGRDAAGARRSAITLKALTFNPTGAVVAAPTTSLPEVIGGERNWDYRYA